MTRDTESKLLFGLFLLTAVLTAIYHMTQGERVYMDLKTECESKGGVLILIKTQRICLNKDAIL